MNNFIEHKKYKLYRFSDEREIVVINKEGLLYVYEDDSIIGLNIWLTDLYKDMKEIMHKDGDNGYCYVLFMKTNGRGVLIEIKTREIILEIDNYEDFKGFESRTILTKPIPDDLINPDDPLDSAVKMAKFRGEYSKEDALLVILDKKQQSCYVYSISNGYVFGPYNFKTIEEYKNGFILIVGLR